MEKQVEKFLTVMMTKVVEGIPNGKGGYLEQPIESEAKMFLAHSNGEVDAAVSLAAYEIFARGKTWSDSVWKGALVVIVGQMPLVGGTTAAFCPQFETVWKEIRFIALAAVIYGHDIHEDSTQCQVILCFLGDVFRGGNVKGESMASMSLRQSIKVASAVIVRRMATAAGSRALLRRALGGLMIGVMPEVVGAVYNTVVHGRTNVQAESAQTAKKLVRRVQEHFKKEEVQNVSHVFRYFLVWLIPVVFKQFVKIDGIITKVSSFLLLQNTGADDALSENGNNAEETEEISMAYMMIIRLVAYAIFVQIAVTVCNFSWKIGQSWPWIVTTAVLGTRSFLNFMFAESITTSMCNLLAYGDIYQGHKALVGLYSLASRRHKPLKAHITYVHISLLIWIIWNFLYYILYNLAYFYYDSEDVLATFGSSYYEQQLSHGFGYYRLRDAMDAVSTVALNKLVEEVRKPEIIITLLGPKRAIDSLLFVAKRLRNWVANPEELLGWLDSASPPQNISLSLLSARQTSLFLGLFWGLATHFNLCSWREKVVVSYAVIVSVPVILWHSPLPEPYENKVWSEVLKSRHRLLFLIPDVDSRVMSKLTFAVQFFERYEKAYQSTSSSWSASKAWFDSHYITAKRYARKYGSLRYNRQEGFHLTKTEQDLDDDEVADRAQDTCYEAVKHCEIADEPSIEQEGEINLEEEVEGDGVVSTAYSYFAGFFSKSEIIPDSDVEAEGRQHLDVDKKDTEDEPNQIECSSSDETVENEPDAEAAENVTEECSQQQSITGDVVEEPSDNEENKDTANYYDHDAGVKNNFSDDVVSTAENTLNSESDVNSNGASNRVAEPQIVNENEQEEEEVVNENEQEEEEVENENEQQEEEIVNKIGQEKEQLVGENERQGEQLVHKEEPQESGVIWRIRSSFSKITTAVKSSDSSTETDAIVPDGEDQSENDLTNDGTTEGESNRHETGENGEERASYRTMVTSVLIERYNTFRGSINSNAEQKVETESDAVATTVDIVANNKKEQGDESPEEAKDVEVSEESNNDSDDSDSKIEQDGMGSKPELGNSIDPGSEDNNGDNLNLLQPESLEKQSEESNETPEQKTDDRGFFQSFSAVSAIRNRLSVFSNSEKSLEKEEKFETLMDTVVASETRNQDDDAKLEDGKEVEYNGIFSRLSSRIYMSKDSDDVANDDNKAADSSVISKSEVDEAEEVSPEAANTVQLRTLSSRTSPVSFLLSPTSFLKSFKNDSLHQGQDPKDSTEAKGDPGDQTDELCNTEQGSSFENCDKQTEKLETEDLSTEGKPGSGIIGIVRRFTGRVSSSEAKGDDSSGGIDTKTSQVVDVEKNLDSCIINNGQDEVANDDNCSAYRYPHDEL